MTPEPIENGTFWEYDSKVSRLCSLNGQGNFMCPEGSYCSNIENYIEIPLEAEKIN